MLKIETTAPLLQYEQPTSKEFKVRARRMICQSQPSIDDIKGDDVENQTSDWDI